MVSAVVSAVVSTVINRESALVSAGIDRESAVVSAERRPKAAHPLAETSGRRGAMTHADHARKPKQTSRLTRRSVGRGPGRGRARRGAARVVRTADRRNANFQFTRLQHLEGPLYNFHLPFDLTAAHGTQNVSRSPSIVILPRRSHRASWSHHRRPGVIRQFHCLVVDVGFVLRALAGA